MEELTIINERGQIVPVVGNPLSPARIKAQFPDTFKKLLGFFIDRGEDWSLDRMRSEYRGAIQHFIPLADTAIVDALWRALQCEQDIYKHLNK